MSTDSSPSPRRFGLGAKLATSAAVVAAAAAVAGTATFGSFSSTTNATQSLSSATVSLALGSTSTLTQAVTGLVPGDSVARAFSVANTSSSGALGTVTFSVTGTGANALTTDATNGLRVAVQECTVAWSTATVPTCSGSASTLLSATAVSALAAGSELTSLETAGTHYLMATVSFPSGADNSFQNLSTVLSYTFTAAQRAGTSL